MEINLEKRINELEARHSFQEDSIERLSSEVRKQQQEIGILKEKGMNIIMMNISPFLKILAI